MSYSFISIKWGQLNEAEKATAKSVRMQATSDKALGDNRPHFLGRWRWRRGDAFGAWQRAMRREQRGYRTSVAGRRYFAAEGQAASIITKQFRRESFRTVRRVLLSFAPWQPYGGA
jgi:hypothetical protein